MTTKKARSAAQPTARAKKTNDKTARNKTAGKRGEEETGVAIAEPLRREHRAAAGPVRVEREIGGRALSIETGRLAKQADGSVLARYGDTMVLATAQSAAPRENIDFFPLTVDYREKMAAAGKFPGGFFKREGRPTSREILTSRIIDRAIRPLFPDGYFDEVQILVQVLCTDQENDSDIVAAIAAFGALAISSIPHQKLLGACRIGLRGGKLTVNPTWSQLRAADSDLNLTVAAHRGAIVMVEAGANEVAEATMVEALALAHGVSVVVVEMIEELVAKAGKPKAEFTPAPRDEVLVAEIRRRFGQDLAAAPFDGANKHEQSEAKTRAIARVVEAFPPPAGATDKEAAAHTKRVNETAHRIIDEAIRAEILRGRRVDRRDGTSIRPISIEVGLMPRCHGSALFTRGETQALCTATLGTRDDEQMMDGIYPEEPKRFLLHYAFPPFSVGEVKRIGAVGRREIGHGALAERAIERLLPPGQEFPYSIRITSEILESNGSSSMATVCGTTLALMDAGVPIKQPVAGIAMGLVMEGEQVAILSDILGTEDHAGDMDFKVAGTGRGITALQMDIKCEGLGREILERALEQARQGRLSILREMLKVMRKPRQDISPNAPRLETVQVPADKIGAVIGPGGRNVRALQEEFETRIHIADDGTVQVAGAKADKVLQCAQRIRDMTAEVQVGQTYKGRVTAIKEFGAFVEILPGQEGLCHVSELSDEFIRSVTDVVRVGDEVEVRVKEIDDFGKIKLTRRSGDLDRGRSREPREGRGFGRRDEPREGRGFGRRDGGRGERGHGRREGSRGERGYGYREGRGHDNEERPPFEERPRSEDRPPREERPPSEDRPPLEERPSSEDRPAPFSDPEPGAALLSEELERPEALFGTAAEGGDRPAEERGGHGHRRRRGRRRD